jgi:hypothetical protein
LLRLGGNAKRKEHGAKRKKKNLLTHRCLLMAFV